MDLKQAPTFAIHCNTAGSDPKRLRLPAASQATATDLTHPSRKRRQRGSGDIRVDQPPAKRASPIHQLEAFGAANHHMSHTQLANGTREKNATPQLENILSPLPLATALATASFEEAEATLRACKDAKTFWSTPDLNVELTEELLSMLRTPGYYSIYHCFIHTENNLHARVSRAFACVVLYKLRCESYSLSSILQKLQQANVKAPRKKNAPRNKEAPRDKYGINSYVKNCMKLGEIYCNLAVKLGGYGIVCLLPVIDDAIWRGLSSETVVAELRTAKLDEKSMPHHQFASSVWGFGIDATYEGTQLLLPNDSSKESKRVMRDLIANHSPSKPVTMEIIDICPVIRALNFEDYTAERLLSLLHFLTSSGRSIRKSLLLAAGGTQARWSSSGDHEHFDARCLGLDTETFSILTDKKRLQETLVLLETKGTIQQTSDKEGSDVSIATKCPIASEGVFGVGAWKQAMIFISFFFAGCEYNNNFNLHGTWALPLFQTLLDRYHKCVDSHLAEQVVPALLQASKFSDQPWKRRAIELVELMPWSSLTSHVRAYFTYRKSLILRTNRDSQSAKQAITTYFAYSKQLDSLADCRLNAIHGYLQHSLAWIALESGRFDEALALAEDWSPFCPGNSTLSIYELRASLRLRTMRGIAKMHAIRYREALTEFESALNTYDTRSRVRQIVLASTIDACCECNYLEKARELSSAEFERLKLVPSQIEKTHFNDHYQREVLISTAELRIRLREHEQAHSLLLCAKHYFNAAPVTVQNDQQRHVRVSILFAQNLHQQANTEEQWQIVLDAWLDVDMLAKKYTVLALSGWDYGLVCLSVHHANVMLGKESDRSWLEYGSQTLQSDGHFWRCGMRTFWFDYILKHNSGISDCTRTRMTYLQEAVKKALS